MNQPYLHRRRITRRLVLGSGLAIAAVAIGVTTAAASSDGSGHGADGHDGGHTAPTVLVPTSFVAQDTATGAYFAVVLDPTSAQKGTFVAAVPGLGLVSSTSRATVTIHSAHSVAVRYSSTATLDMKAHLDPEFGADYRPSGTATTANVRVIAELDPDHQTGSIELWVNNVHHHLEATTPCGAQSVVRSVLTDLNANNAAALYALTDAQMHTATEAQYAALLSANGRFSSVHTTGTLTYKISASGLHAAEQPITATTTAPDGTKHTLNGTLELIGSPQGWKLYSIKPAP